jgi:uncharacterized protein (DUF58 family)
MYKYLRNYFYTRAANSKRMHPIYILPTIDGLKVVVLNITLLIIGLVYANNYVLLFNFLLFCLFLASMFYTHFNLSGIKLQSIQFPALHAKENGVINLHFASSNAQGHFFIRPYFKSSGLKIIDTKRTYQIPTEQKANLEIPIAAIKRGKETIKSIYIETLFPFNFFRCFTFFPIEQECLIYPERTNLQLHEEVEVVETKAEEGDDFHIRNYQLGDSLKRVDWKKLAQTNHWYTRQFQSVKPNPILLILDNTPLEETLKSICFAIHSLHQQNIQYGIKLRSDVMIAPSNSPNHLEHCLRELASYEA